MVYKGGTTGGLVDMQGNRKTLEGIQHHARLSHLPLVRQEAAMEPFNYICGHFLYVISWHLRTSSLLSSTHSICPRHALQAPVQ